MSTPPTTTAERERLTVLYDERLADHDDAEPGYAAAFRSLAAHVCTPGELLVPPLQPDEHLDALRTWGHRYDNAAELHLLEPNQCHANAAHLFATGAADRVAIGYALSASDALWRPHSVALTDASTPTHAGIIETTARRRAYFLAPLSTLGSWAFAASELDVTDLIAHLAPERLDQLHAALERLHDAHRVDPTTRSPLVTLGPAAFAH